MADLIAIDIDLLRQLLVYEPETGELRWLERPLSMFPSRNAQAVWNGRYAGKLAFTADSRGYRYGNIFNRKFKAHRVAWALHHGAWPDGDIDHINGKRADNRMANLRVVDRLQNNRNLRLRASSASGVSGVAWDKFKRRWIVSVGRRYIGSFIDLEEAATARRAAEAAFGFHPNHGRSQ